ncbi:MAG: acyl-CoA dehydrogenase-like protein [Burkholderiales bacterium]|jgi:acyl-CoA dehydrogenase|nr:acyl-CoA dehydrogenase-like protein [Burkholderiales bacterium]
MSEMNAILAEASARLFAQFCASENHKAGAAEEFDHKLWSALREAGMTDAMAHRPGEAQETDLEDALAIVRQAGAAAVRVPLAETMIAGLALSASGLPPSSAILTIGPVLPTDRLTLTRSGANWLLNGELSRVPWARDAERIVVVVETDVGWTTAIAPIPAIILQDTNFADEPRDSVRFTDICLGAHEVSAGEGSLSLDDLRFYGALFRMAAMAGGLARILEMTVLFSQQREQFGRPIAKFQAVQQQIAALACQVASAAAAADAAVEAVNRGQARFEIAAAKCRVGEAATLACSIAHQVHGAMGFVREYPLQRNTRRLWSWRDEFGSDSEWAEWVGRAVAQVGADDLWPFITSDDKSLKLAQR